MKSLPCLVLTIAACGSPRVTTGPSGGMPDEHPATDASSHGGGRPDERPVTAPSPPASSSRTAAGSPSPATAPASTPCAGAAVDLAEAVTDARCVFEDEDRATELRRAYEARFTKAPPEMRAVADGNRHVVLTLENSSSTPLVLPLFVSSAVPLFAVTARRNGKTASLRAHHEHPAGTARILGGPGFARIEIAPGGHASVRIALDPTMIVSRRECGPTEKCAPTEVESGPLPVGTWQLAIAIATYGIPAPTADLAWTSR